MTVLSIQSHVVAGHVGNCAAVFCLERLGIETWGLNTLQFSNHTGHKGFTGHVFSPDHIQELVDGLEKYMDLSSCNVVLSGYLGSTRIGEIVLKTVDTVRKYAPKALYCCDPVMGDVERGVYVSPEIPDFMKQFAVPKADIITPNHFELELLTKRKINSIPQAVEAARDLIRKGKTKIVLVTSFYEPHSATTEMSVLSILEKTAYRVTTPRLFLDFPIVGTGDMMTSLFLGHWLKTQDVQQALSLSVSAVFGILNHTFLNNKTDIQLISAQDQLVTPTLLFKAEII